MNTRAQILIRNVERLLLRNCLAVASIIAIFLLSVNFSSVLLEDYQAFPPFIMFRDMKSIAESRVIMMRAS
jgi:hypothetical protein